MRGCNAMTPALLLLLASSAVAGEPQLGKYLCITDYSAGIILQPDGSLVAGRFTAGPEKQKFFVTMRAEPGRDFEERRERCFTKQQGEALKYQPPSLTGKDFDVADRVLKQVMKDTEREDADPNYKSPLACDSNQFIANCLSNFTADIADHRYLHSSDGTTFADYQNLEVVFELYDRERKFSLYERTWAAPLAFSDTVYRGRCEFVQANQ